MPFQVLALSLQRKFLSGQVYNTSANAILAAANLLQNDVVGSVTIKRLKPKKEAEHGAVTY
jgi:hypothetical protein